MILTNRSRSVNAVSWQAANLNQVYAILGKYSAWTSDSSPPNPDPTTTAITEEFCAIKATPYLMLENDSTGAYSFVDSNNTTRKFDIDVSASDFVTNGGNLVMLQAAGNGSDIISAGHSVFRIVGFATGLVPTGGHTSDTFLPAANISSWGNLVTLENRIPESVTGSSVYTVQALLQF